MTTFCIKTPTGARIDVEIFQMTEAEFLQADNEYRGMCVYCRTDADSCEPDVRWRKCDDCQRCGVFGMEELLISGLVEFID